MSGAVLHFDLFSLTGRGWIRDSSASCRRGIPFKKGSGMWCYPRIRWRGIKSKDSVSYWLPWKFKERDATSLVAKMKWEARWFLHIAVVAVIEPRLRKTALNSVFLDYRWFPLCFPDTKSGAPHIDIDWPYRRVVFREEAEMIWSYLSQFLLGPKTAEDDWLVLKQRSAPLYSNSSSRE